jgi:hypothetical protein
VDRLSAANFKTLYLTHFGPVHDVTSHLTAYRPRITEIHQRVAAWLAEGVSEEENRACFLAAEHAIALQNGLTEAQWQMCEIGNGTAMCADGVRLYCVKGR